jgi:hypothetical protein
VRRGISASFQHAIECRQVHAGRRLVSVRDTGIGIPKEDQGPNLPIQQSQEFLTLLQSGQATVDDPLAVMLMTAGSDT